METCFPTDDEYMDILAYMMSIGWEYFDGMNDDGGIVMRPVVHVDQLKAVAYGVADSLNDLINEDERYRRSRIESGGFEAIYIQDRGIVVSFKGLYTENNHDEDEELVEAD